MKILFQSLVLGLIVSLQVFGQARGNENGSRRKTPTVEIDYEAIRLSRVVTAVRIDEKIDIDGQLNESAWMLATPASDFLQWSPRHGEPSPERTEVRFLYDKDNLYVGFTNFDSDMAHALVKELKEDFNPQDSDQVGVALDSLHDRRSAFSFGVNVAGAKRDQQISNDSQFNMDWDGVWDAKVSHSDEAWFAEFVIPFKTLRFSDSFAQEWGVNMNRRILRRNEESMWSLTPTRYRISRVSQSGTLLGLENIHQGRNLKVTPYVTAGVTQVRNLTTGELQKLKSLGRVFCTETHKDCGYDAGIDAKYSLTSSLTLDATYRTDFAQVEVDQQQVNLTRFNLFFPEKRDFFIENAGTFGFGNTSAATTSSSANFLPFFSRRIGLSDSGTPIPIIGGSRVTGQIRRYDVGFLAMKTDRLGTTPSNNYVVGRVKRNLLRNSWIGSIVTSRDSTVPGDHNRVYGADAHFQFYQRLEFDSFLLRSETPGKSGRDQAKKFSTAWRDEELIVSAEYNTVQANFNPEVGFVRRGANSQYSGDFAWRPLLKKSDLIRNLNFSTSIDYYEGSETGTIETRTQEANVGIQFENNGSISFIANQTFDRLAAPFVIHRTAPAVSIVAGDYQYWTYGLNATSSQNRKFSVSGSFNNGEFWDGRRKSVSGAFAWHPNAHLGVDLSYSRNRVNLPLGNFTTELVGSRIVYGFNARAFLNAFIQYNADTRQVSSNIRFDFIHHPLSHLYIVYNDRRDTLSGQLLERALILKLTNLFNF
jgi:hypothetical protein